MIPVTVPTMQITNSNTTTNPEYFLVALIIIATNIATAKMLTNVRTIFSVYVLLNTAKWHIHRYNLKRSPKPDTINYAYSLQKLP